MRNINELDLLDKRLLYLLNHGADLSYSALAKKLKHGRDTIEYRIRRFEESGVLKSYRAVINPYKFGLTLYKSYLRLANDKERIKNFISNAKRESRTFWVVACDGQWDLIVSIAAQSSYEFHTIQGRLLQEIADLILHYQVYVVVSFKVYREKYLLSKEKKPLVKSKDFFEIGGNPSNNIIDEVDQNILKIITQNCRTSYVEISKKLSLNTITIQKRIAQMEEKKIIVGYQSEMVPESLGLTQFKTQLFLNTYDQRKIKELELFCEEHPKITCFIDQIGDCRVEIETHVENYAEYNGVVDEMREKFPLLIRNFNSVLMHKDYLKWMVL